MHYLNEQNIFLFLVQVLLLLGLAKGIGEIFGKWRQPALTAEILVGVILGPSILGRFMPAVHAAIFPPDVFQQNMLETVAWLGVLFMLLETGLEMDFSSAWRQRGDALKIALSDIIIPMVIAFIPCYFLPDRYLAVADRRLVFALFMATVMTISAMPVAARALRDLKLLKTDMGFLIMSALSVNDIVGWLIFTLVLGMFTQTSFETAKVISMFAITIGFTILCLTAGRYIVGGIISKMKRSQMSQPGVTLTFICLLGMLCGAVTQKIGIHALFGFFLAGIMAGGAKALSERTRQVISQMVYAIFVPLFFANIGLKVDFLKNFDVFLVLLICVIGIGGRFLGAWIGARFSSIPKANWYTVAVAHTPGGTMEIVVAVLALEYRLITEPVFVAIVFGAVASSVILGPWLNYSSRSRKEVSILEFFNRRAVLSDIGAAGRDEAISKLCRVASEVEEVSDAETLSAAVLRRENEMGTGVEEGVAVPHARLSFLKKPIVVFGRSVRGIDWDSPDGNPAQLIFMILTPPDESDAQLAILRSIAQTMSEKQTREFILKAAGEEEIWEGLQRVFAPHRVVKNGGREGGK